MTRHPDYTALMDKQYLGDGLYAGFDGWNVVLATDREHDTHFVYLEPAVMVAAIGYWEQIKRDHFTTKTEDDQDEEEK